MKKFLFLSIATIFLSFSVQVDPLTAKERKYANDYLKTTQNAVAAAIQGLSEQQLKFRSAPDKWSIEDCVKHIAMTEQGLWKMTDSIINTQATPEKRADIKASDEQVIQMLTDRSYKAQAPAELQPKNTPFNTVSEALSSFNSHREKLISYVNSTDKDLRNHVVAFPFGSFDTYQMVLFIGAHSSRHTKQMEEVKADPNFPKN